MPHLQPRRFVYDTTGLADPDLGTVADLARLHVAARRLDLEIILRNTPPALVELIVFVGLAEVLRIEPRRQAEQGEEHVGVEEECEPGDPPL